MASSFGAVLLAGGFGGLVAFLLGLAFARSAANVIALGALGAVIACFSQRALASNELADALARELLNAAVTANALGWLAGTLLVARVRCLEWLEARPS